MTDESSNFPSEVSTQGSHRWHALSSPTLHSSRTQHSCGLTVLCRKYLKKTSLFLYATESPPITLVTRSAVQHAAYSRSDICECHNVRRPAHLTSGIDIFVPSCKGRRLARSHFPIRAYFRVLELSSVGSRAHNAQSVGAAVAVPVLAVAAVIRYWDNCGVVTIRTSCSGGPQFIFSSRTGYDWVFVVLLGLIRQTLIYQTNTDRFLPKHFKFIIH
jgi:hypothetical protein